MRLLHTSDWHLGRSLHGQDLLDAQSAYLDHLVDLVRSERIAGVLVAGDVFDRAVPPLEAVTLLGDTLRRLAEITQVVLIPGNHDSARRLGYGSALWREQVRFAGVPGAVAAPVRIEQDGVAADVYGIPYLDPEYGRTALADGAEPLARSHEAVLGAAMNRVRAGIAARGPACAIVMAHAFVVGGTASESERDIRVGGVDSVAASTFAGAQYAALGHLHGPQQIELPDGALARYAGSPVAYSFSEKDHVKSTTLLTVGPGGSVAAEAIAAPVTRPLAEIRGELADLLGPQFGQYRDHYLRVIATDPARPEQLVARVKDRFPHALVTLHEPPERDQPQAIRVVAGSDPLQVAAQFFEFATGARPTPAEQDVLRAAYEDTMRAEREEPGEPDGGAGAAEAGGADGGAEAAEAGGADGGAEAAEAGGAAAAGGRPAEGARPDGPGTARATVAAVDAVAGTPDGETPGAALAATSRAERPGATAGEGA